jgi:hypothetical protein
MQGSVGTVRTLKQPPITAAMTSNLQLAMAEVDDSWTRENVQSLEHWCLSKAAGCEKASMCAGALEKHLNETHLLQSSDFLKIAFIVNNGLLLVDGNSEDGDSLPSLQEESPDAPVDAVSEHPTLVESNAIESKTDTSELTMAQIEQQMQELLADA